MRLTPEQQHQVIALVHEHLGDEAKVSLYGSRLHAQGRGGDVDLLVETVQPVPLMRKAALKLALEEAICLPVDLLFIRAGRPQSPFQALAAAAAQPIGPTT